MVLAQAHLFLEKAGSCGNGLRLRRSLLAPREGSLVVS